MSTKRHAKQIDCDLQNVDAHMLRRALIARGCDSMKASKKFNTDPVSLKDEQRNIIGAFLDCVGLDSSDVATKRTFRALGKQIGNIWKENNAK